MKKIKWKVASFVCWLLFTMLLLDLGLKVVSQPDTVANIFGVISITLWILLSIATNCFTFKISNNEKEN